MMGWQNFGLSHNNMNIKGYEANKNKEKFEICTINPN
jgi:hypothetical protein